MSTFVRERLFGGSGSVAVTDRLGAGDAPPFAAILDCALSPGGSVGAHRQQEHPELVVGLEGRGEATVDGVAYPLGPGDIVYLPFGAVLSLRNTDADAPLRYLIVKARVDGSPPPGA